jgi:tetratricopeptide (TPR) repeat protein
MTTLSSTKDENCGWLRVLWNHGWLKEFLLIVIVFLAYLPALEGKFIWDDEAWTSNIFSLLSNFSGLRLMWCRPTALQQYYPLVGTTFWLDYQLWGFWTLPYHIENVLLHALGALLFWRLLRRLQVPGAWLAGAIFALHPINTESVAWITERKNVLSLPLYLGALLAYGIFTHFWKMDSASTIDNSSLRCRRAYVLSFLLFLAAMLAKTTAFSLPAVILLICWWKRGRIQWRADLLPTLPFFVVSVGLSQFTSWLEKHHLGAMGTDWSQSLPQRCLIAGHALWFYAGKLFWPVNLTFIYPRWQINSSMWWQWIFPMASLGVVALLWFLRQRIGRGPLVAVLFFSGTLFPVLGFMNVYYMRYSFVSDHWGYLSNLGLIALTSAVIVRIAKRFQMLMIFREFVVAVLLVLAILTWRQSRMYIDPETLWQITIDRNSNCWMAYNNLGVVLLQKGQVDEAIIHYQKALEINPHYADAHFNLGAILFQNGQVDAAAIHFKEALEINPDDVDAQNNLGLALLQKGQVDEAIDHFKKALEINPNDADVNSNLGDIFLQERQIDKAIICYKKALKIKPDSTLLQNHLGHVAWVLATSSNSSIRNGTNALDLALYIDELSDGKNPRIIAALAAAYAEIGRFPEAIVTAQQALQMASSQNNSNLITIIQTHLKFYEKNSPFRSTEQIP